MEQQTSLKPLSFFLNKNPEDWQRKDLLKIIRDHEVRQINLHYTSLDGKLKELKVPVNSLNYANQILAQGERIDGSSVFKGVVDTAASDLYVVPMTKTAFLSPFEDNTLGIFCQVMDKNGAPATFVPENILSRAHTLLTDKTGLELHALGELEFYIIFDKQNPLFAGTAQRSYHASEPFVKCSSMVNEMLHIATALTGSVKYAHSEVGYIDALTSANPEIAGKCCEQFEIEFLPRPVEDMARYLVLTKWIIRNVAFRWNCCVTFTPKIEEGAAGNGLHLHLKLLKNKKSIMVNDQGALSDECLQFMGGLCHLAPSLTAFGNTIAGSYLRLVPHQEAPTKICWSEKNRSALIRVPLGWNNTGDLAKKVNPQEKEPYLHEEGSNQTVEIRSPDGSASIHLLLAGVVMAAFDGLTSAESLARAKTLHVTSNIFENKDQRETLEGLPSSCFASAQVLIKDRLFFEHDGIFPPQVIDHMVRRLIAENDQNLPSQLSKLSDKERLDTLRALLHKDLHKR